MQKEAKSNSKLEDKNKSEEDGAVQILKETKGNSEPKDENKYEGDNYNRVPKSARSNFRITVDKNKKVD